VTNGRERGVAAASALAALASSIAWRGWVVDDAWIPARYAANLATGHGYRFDATLSASDGVTPLPWAPLLVVLSVGGDVARAVVAARAWGVVCWMITAALLAVATVRSGDRPARFAPLVLGLCSAPLGAWSVGGLETPLVTLLVTIAVVAGPARGSLSCGAAGLAGAFRPEALPLVLVLGTWAGTAGGRARRFGHAAIAFAPWACVVAVRLACFGLPYPLSALAKQSDLPHGLVYVAGFVVFGGLPVLVASRGVAAVSRARWLVVAAVAHTASVAIAGGDWMPLSRLMVPILPVLLLAAVDVAERAGAIATGVRVVIASVALLVPWVRLHGEASGVWTARQALIGEGRGALAPYHAVAALDVGWVGAATEARVVDLAGLTDRAFASLPGGHTTKRVPATLLDARGVEAFVLLRRAGSPRRDDGGPFDRRVEEEVAGLAWVKEQFVVARTIRGGALEYVVLERRAVGGP
jgi:hypothetical protein